MPAKAKIPTPEIVTNGGGAVVIEVPRSRVSVEIERLARGPAKVSIRVDGDDLGATADEAFEAYKNVVARVDKLFADEEGGLP